MRLTQLIINQYLPVLTVPQRLVLRRVDYVEPAVCLAEYVVDFFQGAVCCFRVEEVDYGEDEGVSRVEVLVGFLWVLGERWWERDVEGGKGRKKKEMDHIHDGEYNVSLIPNRTERQRRNHHN